MIFEFNGNSRKSGVYQIRNIQNEKVYIGSCKEFKTRAKQHLSSLRNGKHQNKHLQASYNKWGEKAFIFEILFVMEADSYARRQKEQELIDQFLQNWNQCYNLAKKVTPEQTSWSKNPDVTRRKISRALTGRKLSSDHVEKMRQTKTGQVLSQTHKLKIKQAMRAKNIKGPFAGKHLSEEHKKKISNSLLGDKNPFFAKTHTKEQKEKMSKSHLGKISSRRKKVLLININTNEQLYFDSVMLASLFLKRNVSKVIKKKTKTYKNWKVEYV